MGSWSVYCGISNITITSGDSCVLIPLKKSKGEYYSPYLPETLPIFGKYDDYGGIEDIEKNAGTNLLEEFYGCSIEEYCAKLVDEGCYMWVLREVYDFMRTYVHNPGNLDYGDAAILNAMGAEYLGVDESKERYTQKWELQGKTLYSDGTWLEGSIYSMYGEWGSFESKGFEITPEMKDLGTKGNWQLWHLRDKHWARINLLRIMGREPYPLASEEATILNKISTRIEIFSETLSDLITVRHNFGCMSGYWKPFVRYVTPQCGEHEHHQVLLEKFSQINKKNLQD